MAATSIGVVFKKTILFLLITLVAFSCATTEDSSEKASILFNGETIVNEAIGLTVFRNEGSDHIAVTNRVFNYSLYLPYSENWEFLNVYNYCFFAINEDIKISIQRRDREYERDKEFLKSLLGLLMKNADEDGIISIEFLAHEEDILILESVVDISLLTDSKKYIDLEEYNYWLTKSIDEYQYLLHFSIVESDRSQERIDDYLSLMIDSFMVFNE